MTLPDRDKSIVRHTWAPLLDRSLWLAITRLGQLIEFHMAVLGQVEFLVDYR
jgi:hypothetical protein